MDDDGESKTKSKSSSNNASVAWRSVESGLPGDLRVFLSQCETNGGVRGIRVVLFDNDPTNARGTTRIVGKGVTVIVREEKDYKSDCSIYV